MQQVCVCVLSVDFFVVFPLLFNFARTKCEHVMQEEKKAAAERRCSMEKKKKSVAERKGIGNNERVHAHSLIRSVVCSPAPLLTRSSVDCGRRM